MFLGRDLNHVCSLLAFLVCSATEHLKQCLGILGRQVSQLRVTRNELLDNLLESSGVLLGQFTKLVHLWSSTTKVDCTPCACLGPLPLLLLLPLLGKLATCVTTMLAMSQTGRTWNRF